MNQNRNDTATIDLSEIFHALLAKIWVILLVTAIGIGVAAGYTELLVEPTYESTAMLYVLTKSTSITSLADIQMGTSLTQDYMVIITSRPVVEKVIRNLDLPETYEELQKKISVENRSDTRVLDITVRDHDAARAKKIVDNLSDVSREMMENIMETQAPNVIAYGQVPDRPASPSLVKNAVVGGLLGLLIICAIIIIRYLANDSIRTSEDVEKYLGLNTLGLVPLEEGTSRRRTHGRDQAAGRKKHKHKRRTGRTREKSGRAA